MKADAIASQGERKDEAKAKTAEQFAQVLTRLVSATILTQAQADEILSQYNLGGDAQEQAIKRLRTLLQEQKVTEKHEKGLEQFTQSLTRLVGAGVLTQAQADEILAQYKLGGDAQEQVTKRLRTLLQDQQTAEKRAKGAAEFAQTLPRLVGAGVLTQAQANEILAQYNLGGDAQEQVIKRLKALLSAEKPKRDEKKDLKADEKKTEKREQADEKSPPSSVRSRPAPRRAPKP